MDHVRQNDALASLSKHDAQSGNYSQRRYRRLRKSNSRQNRLKGYVSQAERRLLTQGSGFFRPPKTSQRLITSTCWAIALTIFLWAINSAVLTSPSIAQTGQGLETTEVVLDGQTLFNVTGYLGQSSQERADTISSKLASAIDDAIEVNHIGSTIIFADNAGNEIDNGEILTVQKNDIRAFNLNTDSNLSAEELANQWTDTIEQALKQAREERSPDFLRQAILLSIAALAFAAIAHWWLRRIQRRIMLHPLQELQRLFNNPESDITQIRALLLRSLTSIAIVLARAGIWFATVVYVINVFPQTRDRSYEIFRAARDSLFSPILPLGEKTYSVTDLFILVAAFFGVFLGATLIANVLRSRILNMAGISTGSQEAIAALTRYTLIALGTLIVLQVWGLDLSSLTLLASALGVGIGFGFQNIAKDFGSGLILLFERPVQVGDFVEVGEFQGTVDRIGARSTRVKTLDQVSIIVPNSYFLENQVINWSHENPLSRIAIPVGVSYKADPEHVRKILLHSAENHSGIVRLPKPQVFFNGFGDSSLDFLLLVWIVEPNRQPSIKSDLYFQIFTLFKEEGVEIPFPQRDLHLRSSHLPAELNSIHHSTPSNPLDHPMG